MQVADLTGRAGTDRVVTVDAKPHSAGVAEDDIEAMTSESQLLALPQDGPFQKRTVASDLDIARPVHVVDPQRRWHPMRHDRLVTRPR